MHYPRIPDHVAEPSLSRPGNSSPRRPQPPSSLSWALVVSLGISAVSGFAVLIINGTKDSIVEVFQKENPGLSNEGIEFLYDDAFEFAAFFGLTMAGLMTLLTLIARQGHNGARIVTSASAVISIAGGVISFQDPITVPVRILQVVIVIWVVGLVLLLWLPESSRYISTVRHSGALRRRRNVQGFVRTGQKRGTR